MNILPIVARRFAIALPQLFIVTTVTFLLVRLLPGNPAYTLAGLYATKANVAAIDKALGLSLPLPDQYWSYITRLLHGNLGTSSYTGKSITSELAYRLPATLELISVAAIVILVLGVALGTVAATRERGALNAGLRLYGGLSGALPDFWLGLGLAYVFYFLLGALPAPTGQLSLGEVPPGRISGMYVVDSILSGNLSSFVSSSLHLVLPAVTLIVAYMGAIVKLTSASVRLSLSSPFCRQAKASGLPSALVVRYALRHSTPEIVTLFALTYTFLLAGDVLVENVYSWGGLGSFMVDSLNHSDYTAIQGIILVVAVFNLLIYLLVDVVQMLVDPRVRV